MTSTYGIYGYQTNGFSGNANYYVYLNNSTFTGTAVYSYGLVEVPLQTRLLDQNTAFGGYNLIGSL
ncbi:hypothetical protein ACWOFR_03805 [Carnobacterium gallinarum]|uniref:hypothetical protein n=1 Tax=Carnobacterium gallinarum TaxID=2749 RepID=UPI0014707742|nr:hypothetical protein [Carnobacterium gallinarum]